ncbi:uncharacterized protein LOC112604368 isoform X2 [Melanaphis sacchari]|uniref:Neurensin-1 n=2 Tax=Melanaphis sacchari TaxID=742174 RepID=A0A2H8TQ14_9HEMI|nr:uncharacterized protein LOC112604368 isoform X2 [Melanaphis sacchari]XP_025209148.1 uncharacterized protein LOC112604368 isoform X2 [Melanaphis sacchari]XP_025209150.1 uncharacterized protein LOC112604368 isoform X2 [Melanaphis sacchari]
MTSDNDGDSVAASSGYSDYPNPVPGAKTGRVPTTAAAKGILVHNNKKSANTNRVSFVTNSSSSTSSSSSPSPLVERSKKKNHQQQRSDNESDEVQQLPYYARTGRRLTGFGVKSYLHEFYDDPDDCELFQDDDGNDDDDFKYFVEPEIRWYHHCSGAFAVLGLVVMAVGATAMAVGHLLPAKDPVVDRSTHMEVIDRRAVSFNDHLASCRYIGSMVFAVGFVFTVVRFWTSVIRNGGRKIGGNGDMRAAKKLRVGKERSSPTRTQTVRIPISGRLESVQPDPLAIKLQFADSG